jgi:hypothetical protein
MKYYFLIMFFLMMGCGASPLLNHTMEKNGLSGSFNPARAETYRFKKTTYQFTIDWLAGPSLGESKFLLRSWNKEDGTISGPYHNLPYELAIELWMPSMGHGSAPVKIKKLASGEYEVSSVHFIMGGKWDIIIRLMNKKDIIDEVIIPLTI